ncbi:MAG TPA: uracil-DNA glycosylase [Candidatus Paceibacterota bacterium]
MKKIKDEIVALSSSPLYSYRSENNYFPVIGEGSHDAKIMFIGEAPGLNEAKTGRPFCGRAGKVLDDLLLSIGIPRSDVYITNIVKDRPPENRDPFPDEIKIYAPFLERQIEIIKPKVIATLGRYSMKYIMEKFDLADLLGTIGTLHGKPLEKEVIWGKLTILPLYHPAVAVYNSNMLTALKEDFKKLKEFV